MTEDQSGPLNREQRRHPEKNDPARSEQPPRDSHAGRADQDVTENTGTGAGGATEYGGGNKYHPSRIAGKPPGHGA
jgi:hypothetical protein